MSDKKDKLNFGALLFGFFIAFCVFGISYYLIKEYLDNQKSVVLANSDQDAGVVTENEFDDHFQRLAIRIPKFHCLDTLGRIIGQEIEFRCCHGTGGNQEWLYNKHTGRLMSSSSRNCLLLKKRGVFLSACSNVTDHWTLPSVPDTKLNVVTGHIFYGCKCFSVASFFNDTAYDLLRFSCGYSGRNVKLDNETSTLYQNWTIEYME